MSSFRPLIYTRQSLSDTKALPLAALSLDSPGRQVSRQNLSSVKGKNTRYEHKSPNQKRTKERGEAPAFPLLPPNPCPPSLPPIWPFALSPKITSKGPKNKEKTKRPGVEEPKVWEGCKMRKRSSKRLARSAWTKKPNSNPKPKATTTATSYVWVTELKLNQIQTKRGRKRGEEGGVRPCLSVRFNCGCCSCIDRRKSFPPSLCRQPRLCSHFLFLDG